MIYFEEHRLDRGNNDIEPTSFTDAPFNFTFKRRASGLSTLFQQNPSMIEDCIFPLPKNPPFFAVKLIEFLSHKSNSSLFQ